MYNIKLYEHVPAPDAAKSHRIVAAHYYPSWTKGENTLNREFADLSEFPERTPLMGYYEDKNPEVIDWEIKWALEHGINCFIYCWYRKRENMGKPVTRNGLRLGQGLHEGLFLSRYGNQMQFAIMFETQPRWGAADREDLLTNVLPFWFEEYFARENYLQIDGKPVVFLYDTAHQLRDMLGGDAAMKEALDACRAEAVARGYKGLIFAEQMKRYDGSYVEEAVSRGVDFIFAYNWFLGKEYQGAADISASAMAKQMEYNKANLAVSPYRFCPTVGQFWDPETRLHTMPFINYGPGYWYLSFTDYRKLLRETDALCEAAPADSIAHQLIMVDNFNEWDEGHFLLPSYRFGFKHLQCIREELTDRQNLPDYRMPDQLGFGPYDAVWNVGNLSGHNHDRTLDRGEMTDLRKK